MNPKPETTATPAPVKVPPPPKPEGKPPAATKPGPKPGPKPAAEAPAKKGSTLTGADLAQAVILKKLKAKPDAGTTMTHTYVPTGSALIDDVIGGSVAYDGKGRVCPGYPRRRITEIFGAESSGKTTAALQAIAEVQRQGGWALYLDYEHSIDHGYARKIGVSYDKKKLLLYQPSTVEEGFEYMHIGVMAGADLIVVDSVAAMIPKKDLDAKVDAEAQIGLQARAFSRQLPKLVNIWLHHAEARKRNPKGTAVVLINQTRSSISAGGGKGGGDTQTTGGKALKFYAGLRLMFSRIRSETVAKKDKFTGKEANVPFGNHTKVKVVKNKMDGKQGHSTEIFIRYGVGIDEFYSLIEAAVVNKVVKKETGGWYIYKNERFHGREKFRAFLKENAKLFQEIREQVLGIVQASAEIAEEELDEVDQLIMQTENETGDDEGGDDNPEEVEVDDEASSEDSDSGDD